MFTDGIITIVTVLQCTEMRVMFCDDLLGDSRVLQTHNLSQNDS